MDQTQTGIYEPIDKLIVCTQALYDARISELRRENELLKLRLFWASEGKLKNLIRYHGCTINCGCVACHVGNRTNSMATERACRWQPIFEKIIKECDLSCSSGGPGDEKFYGMNIMDTKTYLCSGLKGDWVSFVGFGEKFKTASITEHDKYVNFVKRIWNDIRSVWLMEERDMEEISSGSDDEQEI